MPRVEVASMAGQTGRVDFTPSEYVRLIQQKGYRARWEKATLCPFRSPSTPMEHDITHTTCDQGWTFYDPREIKVLMTGLSKSQQFRDPGRLEPGTAYATTEYSNRLGFWDKITLLDSSMRFMELVRRQSMGSADITKYEVVDILDVRDTSRTYTRDTDYQIIGGRIVWLSTGARPASTSLYSISYTFRPAYLVLDLIHDIRDTFILPKGNFPALGSNDEATPLPVQAMVRLHFLARNQGLDAPPTIDFPDADNTEPGVETLNFSETAT